MRIHDIGPDWWDYCAYVMDLVERVKCCCCDECVVCQTSEQDQYDRRIYHNTL